MKSLDTYTDADARRTILNALRLVGVAVVLGVPVLWWKLGWKSALLFVGGALISCTGLFEWLRLMTALMVRMEVDGAAGRPVRPMAPVLIGFFLRLGLAVGVLYVSLKFLDGSVYALVTGLALGIAALSIEGLRLVKSWTT